ncbi:MAG: alpha/beta hydrolase [Pseudomonadales bacterium]|nr:alpha/beta hydrolase [Pseudomonadales bacterium]MCP5185537.1 alpha/beta hydrolase [Pseudomonadales bacterium]
MFRKLLRALSILLVLLLVSGFVYEHLAARHDRLAYPPPGKHLAVDGLALHVDCRGAGSPVLLLEAGLTSGSASWALVHDQLASATRVCAYDRPGMDWSEDGDVDRRAGAVAERLHTLISAADIHEPMVLLGMSAGGVYVREYFARYPIGIAGMVLVDSSHEQQAKRLPGGDTSVAMTTMLTLCRGLQPFGVVRLTHGMDGLLDAISVPPDVRELLRATYYQTGRCAAIQEETAAFMADLAQAPTPRSLGDLPLLVISQGKPAEANPMAGISLELARAQRDVWDALQEELTGLSTNGRRVIADSSGHVVQFEQPDLLAREVTAFVKSLREPGRVSHSAAFNETQTRTDHASRSRVIVRN